MVGTLGLTLMLFVSLHLTVPAVVPHAGESGEKHASQAIDKPERTQELTRLPLDVVLVKQRLYEAPTTLRFTVVTPSHPDNREAGVELRCNSLAVASTTWTLNAKSNTVREFQWRLTDENCLYELVAILMRTADYLYLYQMVPSRAWLPYRTPSRQLGRGSRF